MRHRAVLVSPVCALLTARCAPEPGRVQAELGARSSFRDAAGIPDSLLATSPATLESLPGRTHALAGVVKHEGSMSDDRRKRVLNAFSSNFTIRACKGQSFSSTKS